MVPTAWRQATSIVTVEEWLYPYQTGESHAITIQLILKDQSADCLVVGGCLQNKMCGIESLRCENIQQTMELILVRFK